MQVEGGGQTRRWRVPVPEAKPWTTSPPSFCVVVAAWRAASTVGEAVASALSQTYPPLEVIVCDDASPDDVVGALAPVRDRISLVRNQVNLGEGGAKNIAARAAQADFLVILDADDVFLPERLEAIAELAVARPDLDVITTDAYLEAGGRVVRRCYESGHLFETENQRRAILDRNFILGLAAVRRDAFWAAGGFDESISHATDWDLWIRLILGGARVGLVDEPLARYRLSPASLSGDREKLVAGRVAVLEKAAQWGALAPDERDIVRRAIARERRRLALVAARAALRDGRKDARRLSIQVAFGRGQRPGSRLKALASALSPRTASALLRRRNSPPGAADIVVSDDPADAL